MPEDTNTITSSKIFGSTCALLCGSAPDEPQQRQPETLQDDSSIRFSYYSKKTKRWIPCPHCSGRYSSGRYRRHCLCHKKKIQRRNAIVMNATDAAELSTVMNAMDAAELATKILESATTKD